MYVLQCTYAIRLLVSLKGNNGENVQIVNFVAVIEDIYTAKPQSDALFIPKACYNVLLCLKTYTLFFCFREVLRY